MVECLIVWNLLYTLSINEDSKPAQTLSLSSTIPFQTLQLSMIQSLKNLLSGRHGTSGAVIKAMCGNDIETAKERTHVTVQERDDNVRREKK